MDNVTADSHLERLVWRWLGAGAGPRHQEAVWRLVEAVWRLSGGCVEAVWRLCVEAGAVVVTVQVWDL